jgi:hypothetical protein
MRDDVYMEVAACLARHALHVASMLEIAKQLQGTLKSRPDRSGEAEKRLLCFRSCVC